jgi:tol-pal system protein YbgF
VGLGGCAALQPPGGSATQQDVAQLRQELNALTLTVRRGRSDTDAALAQLDRRSREQSTETARQLSTLSARLDGLAADLGRITARLDEIAARAESAGRAPSTPRPAPGPTSTPAAPAPPAPAAATPAARPGAEGTTAEQAYKAAYLDFSKGSYPLAISGFREFLRRFPDSLLADKAQYWIGEAYFSLASASAGGGRAAQATREWEQAVQEFRRVVLNYPRAEKVPTALYKEGLALIELKQTRLARSRFKYLIDNFPQSEEAPLAKERLAALPG